MQKDKPTHFDNRMEAKGMTNTEFEALKRKAK